MRITKLIMPVAALTLLASCNPTTRPASTSTSSTSSSSTPTSEVSPSASTSVEPIVTGKKFYFQDKGWWNKDAAESWVYLFADEETEKTPWPGTVMTIDTTKPYVAETHPYNIWYFELDAAETLVYTKAVISRRSSSGGSEYWGAQTVDIDLMSYGEGQDTIVLTDTESWYNPEKPTEGAKAATTWAKYSDIA